MMLITSIMPVNAQASEKLEHQDKLLSYHMKYDTLDTLELKKYLDAELSGNTNPSTRRVDSVETVSSEEDNKEDKTKSATERVEEVLNNSRQKKIDEITEKVKNHKPKPKVVVVVKEQDSNIIATTTVQSGAEDAVRNLNRALSKGSVYVPAFGSFTSGFGPRWGTMHEGIDIANSIGTPIYAVMSGTVIDSGPASGYGTWIRIKHDDGSMSTYGHMERLDVSVGERVEAGQVIAGMGNLGFSTGSHLHFEIAPDGITPVDPVEWFKQYGILIS